MNATAAESADAVPTAGSAGRITRILAIGARRGALELTQFMREREAVVFTFALPFLVYAVFAITQTGDVMLAGETIGHRQYMLPGILASAILLTGFQSTAIGFAQDRASGALLRLKTTPLHPVSYFIGKAILVAVTSAVQIALLLAFAAALGVPAPRSWALLVAVWLLGCLAGTTTGVALATVLRSPRGAVATVTGITLLLQFVCGGFLMFASLPDWLQSAVGPLFATWIARGMRAAVLPERMAAAEPGGTWAIGVMGIVLVGWIVAGLALSAWRFRWNRV